MTLVAYDAQSTSLAVTDGTHSTGSAGGSPLALAVAAASDNAYRIGATTTTPQAGVSDALTLNIVDQYQNPSSTTGSKTITFGGLNPGPDGSLPTVNGTPLGTGTAISFSGGSATATLVAYKAENGMLLTATSSGPTLSAAATGGTAPTLSPTAGNAAGLGISTEPSATATAGVAFAQQPVIGVYDAHLNPVTTSSAAINVNAAVGNVFGRIRPMRSAAWLIRPLADQHRHQHTDVLLAGRARPIQS